MVHVLTVLCHDILKYRYIPVQNCFRRWVSKSDNSPVIDHSICPNFCHSHVVKIFMNFCGA